MLIKVKAVTGQNVWIDAMNVGSLRPARDEQGRPIINGTAIIFKNGEPPIATETPSDDIAKDINDARELVLKLAGVRHG